MNQNPVPRRQRANFRFKSVGFDPLQKPEIPYPTMKAQITGLSNNDLGDLMSQYGVWREYTEDLLLHAIREYTSLAESLNLERQMLLITVNGRNRDERLAKIDTQPEIIELAHAVLESEMYKEMLSAKLASIENSIAVISREITRRGNENNYR